MAKKIPASPIRIPTVSSDIDWDYCFLESQQTKIPAQQPTEESYPTSGSEESEDDTKAKEKATDCMSLPWEKLAQSQEKIAQLIKEKMVKIKNSLGSSFHLKICPMMIKGGSGNLQRLGSFEQIVWPELVTDISGAITPQTEAKCGLPAQAKKHAESAKNTLLTWKRKTASDKERKGILEALVMLYYTLGVACLLQNRSREAYLNLQKAERNMEELKELQKGGVCGLQVSEKDLTIALGRASLAIQRLNLALAYFEKAINSIIAAKGAGTSDLVPLYTEVAQIEQLRRNHHQAIQYLQQAHSICVSLFTEVSPQTAKASALLAKAYAMSGEAQHIDVAEMYFIKSISAYQTTLGPENCETLMTIGEFYKWLIHNGEKEEAHRLLKASLKSRIISYGNYSEKVAETFYNMGRISFAKGDFRQAIHLLRKVNTGWFC
ncbi:tetratricopeptide repeat protein 23-like [Pteropus vampyrus]|uniref:Tetratricopeptide repeat protein 23-like n=1 Tax=Pteropus vampyrus TaxID=132908 RepID=A0A6P6BWD6_PTEVA|nr:tetratricopeptide repeat protein 23-like [Pteropus vampyrus]